MKSFFQLYQEFGKAFDVFKGRVIQSDLVSENKAAKLAWDLVHEEVHAELGVELSTYLANPSLENKVLVADGIGDSIYVLCQLAYSLGIPLDEVYREIHRSNMAKIDPETGTIKRREDGKVLKPDGWTPPDIWNVLKLRADVESFERKEDGAESWKREQVPGATSENPKSLD